MVSWTNARQSAARRVIWLAAFSAAACLVIPKGLVLFASCLLLATMLRPEALLRAPEAPGRSLLWLAGIPLLVLAVTGISMVHSGQGWRVLDNPSRLLLIPWCACLAWALGLTRRSLWLGAMVGLAVAFAVAVLQSAGGSQRADAGANPIVFANAVLVLLVMAVFCRPVGRDPWVLVALASSVALAVVAIVLSGSRGVLPGLAIVLLVLLVGGDARRRWWRLGLSAGGVMLFFSLLWSIPWLSAQTRLDDVQADWNGYAKGQVDTPIGARLALLSLAGDAFRRAPWTGVGIDRFGEEVARAPYCRSAPRHLCDLEHAHNDVAQWSATMGVPGLLALLAIYGVPLGVVASQLRRARPPSPVGAGWAAGILIVTYMLSGLTQSMFAHATTVSAYAVFVGLLLGIALSETEAGQSEDAPIRR
ncbi:O-antigen ligase family protein [Pseudoxanthomonas putridarboris]|uniref:O-antigen ligase family protein n=2 Tax=Pseudoxanthomonas putridarboris TaxID=752605 RepID=A0ABU9IVV5_9GAMM